MKSMTRNPFQILNSVSFTVFQVKQRVYYCKMKFSSDYYKSAPTIVKIKIN